MTSSWGRALQHPTRAVEGLTRKALSVVGQRRYRRFIILSRSRTGSNLLASYLNSHPQMHANGELLRHLGGTAPRAALSTAFAKEPHAIKAAGFKLFYNHPQDGSVEDLWDALAEMPDLSVLHLKRRNLLRTLVSRRIAATNDVWIETGHRTPPVPSPKQVELSVDGLAEAFHAIRRAEERADEFFGARPFLKLHYEDLVEDPQAQFRSITDFLGVAPRQPRTRLRRQNPEPLSQLIVDYDELRRAFAGTEWSAFFDG